MEINKIAWEREYIPNLNAAIKVYNESQKEPTTYTQRQLEAMFDYSYNNGLGKNSADNTHSTKIDDEEGYEFKEDLVQLSNSLGF